MMTIIRARSGEHRAVFFIGCTDTAVNFAHWLVERGWVVEMTDGAPHPRTLAEKEWADALTRTFIDSTQ